MTHFPGRQELAAEIGAVHAQADGILTVEIVRKQDLLGILCAARLGDPWAVMIHNVIGQSARRIEAATRDQPYLCACCPRPIRPGGEFSFAIAIPACDSPKQGIGFAICSRCGTTLPDLMACARRALMKIWPDLRPISVHPTGGTA